MLQRYDVSTEEVLYYNESVYAESPEEAKKLFIQRLKDDEYFGEAETSMFIITNDDMHYDVMSGVMT